MKDENPNHNFRKCRSGGGKGDRMRPNAKQQLQARQPSSGDLPAPESPECLKKHLNGRCICLRCDVYELCGYSPCGPGPGGVKPYQSPAGAPEGRPTSMEGAEAECVTGKQSPDVVTPVASGTSNGMFDTTSALRARPASLRPSASPAGDPLLYDIESEWRTLKLELAGIQEYPNEWKGRETHPEIHINGIIALLEKLRTSIKTPAGRGDEHGE